MSSPKPMEALLQGTKSLYVSEKHSDFKIKCNNDVYPIYKAIICPRWPVFETTSQIMKVKLSKHLNERTILSKRQEADEKEMNLSKDKPELVKLMIQYFYELDYSVDGGIDQLPESVRHETLNTKDQTELERNRYFAESLARLNPEAMEEAVKIYKKYSRRSPTEDHAYIMMLNDPHVGDPCKPLALQDAPILHAKMYAIADRWDVKGLKELVIEKFIAVTGDHFTNQGFYNAIEHEYNGTRQ
ncbi:Nn.00g108150.m01.CDS01 [Neocucurbitaria sp. VM-36]